MDAYVYVRALPGQSMSVAEKIAELGVREVVVVTGAWDIMVAVEGLEASLLGETVIDGIQRIPGVTRTYTCPVLQDLIPHPIPLPMRYDGDLTLLVHVQVEAGAGADVGKSLAALKSVKGMAVVAGEHDLLVEIGGRNWDQVSKAVVRDLQSVKGIRATTTSLAISPKLMAARKGTTARGRTARRKKSTARKR